MQTNTTRTDMLRHLRMFVLLALLSGLLLGCGRVAPPQAAVAMTLLELLLEFSTATLPIKKFGRVGGIISISGGKAAIKIETEIAKSGIKIGGQIPVLNFQNIARSAYLAKHGKEPNGEFNQTEDSGFIIVDNNGEHYIFIVDSSSFCVANIEDPTPYQISFQERYVKISVSGSEADVKFGSSSEDCEAISSEIIERQTRKREEALRQAYSLLEIEDAVVNANESTGEVVVNLVHNGRETKASFWPQDFISKNGISDHLMLAKFVKNVKPSIEHCTIGALNSGATDYVALLESRSTCLTEKGFNANDQVYFEVRKLYDT